jgi:hypothetical protein
MDAKPTPFLSHPTASEKRKAEAEREGLNKIFSRPKGQTADVKHEKPPSRAIKLYCDKCGVKFTTEDSGQSSCPQCVEEA